MQLLWKMSSGWSLLLISVVYGSVLVIITLMYLSGLIWTQHVACWSPTSRAPLDKVGGNYWGHAWLSSQGLLFFRYSNWTKQRGFSLSCILRTLITLSFTSSWSLHIPATHSSHRHVCILYVFVFACMYICIWMCNAYMQKRRSLSLVEHLIMLLIKGEHISSFFHFLNWAISSTVLLVITNLVGRYGGEEGMKSWKLVNKNRGKTGERLVKIREGRIVIAKERAVIEWYNEAKMQSVTNVWGREKR